MKLAGALQKNGINVIPEENSNKFLDKQKDDVAICRGILIQKGERIVIVKVGIIDTEIEKKKNTLHGTEIANILAAMNSDVDITGVEVLDANTKGKVSDLIDAIGLCIERKVDFINLSLGYSSYNKTVIQELHQVCQKAIDNDIVIVAAQTNSMEKRVYPASFPEVISVNSDYEQKKYCEIFESEITFNFDVLYVEGPDLKIREGNSYLVPFVIGLLSHMYAMGIKKEELLMELKKMISKKNLQKIVVNSVSERFKKIINKKIGYVTYGAMSANDYNVISYLETITKSIKVYDVKKVENINELQDVDIVFWGIGDCVGTFNNRREVRSLIKQYFIGRKCIISVLPYFNLWERYQFTKDNNNQFISIYN